MVKVAVIGVGFVGLTHAAVTAKFGHDVTGYDISEEKVKAFKSGSDSEIKKYIYEKGLSGIISEELSSGRLKFTTNKNDLANNDIYFMCLPTPYKPNGESDLSFLFNASKELLPTFKKNDRFTLIVNKSTVPIGTAARLSQYFRDNGLQNFDVASNPEFLPEGDAVEHATRSSKIVVGTDNPQSKEIFKKVYSNFWNKPETVYVETNAKSAECTKYVSNFLLYNQIVVWPAVVAPITERHSDILYEDVRRGVLADKRIAKWGSYLSAGAGGSCFKKDLLSLAYQFEQMGIDTTYLRLVDAINENNKTGVLERSVVEGKFDFEGKNVAMLGTAFKQETNDIRESNALKMIEYLLSEDVNQINIYDPLALDATRKFFASGKSGENFQKLNFTPNIRTCLADSDAAVIATDHQEFRTIKDALSQAAIHKPYLLIDGRRMLPAADLGDLLENGISYLPVGGTYFPAK